MTKVFIPASHATFRFPVLLTPLKLLSREERLRKIATNLQLSKSARLHLEWILWHNTHGGNSTATARHFGIARKTFWKWRRRFNDQNLYTLEEHSKAPIKRRQREITQQQENRILVLKKANIRYGKMKIAALYETDYGEHISSWKAQKVIEKYKLYYHPKKQARINRKRQMSVKRKRITKLTTKPLTGFLFCLDTIVIYWKGLKRYIFTGIDKYSKLAFARMYTQKSSLNAKDFLHRLRFLLNGNMMNVGHDNGSEFKKYFEKACAELHINQYFSRPKTPKDNATNERFNRTLEEEFIQMGNFTPTTIEFNKNLTEWLIEYNFRRPHQSLNYMSPISFIQKDAKLLPMYPSRSLA